MIRQIVLDSVVGILILIGLLLAWNFPNPIGEHDVIKSKLGFNASFEFDLLIFMTVFFIVSVVCHYKKFKFVKLVSSISNVIVFSSSILVLMVATESLYVSGDSNEMFSNKFFIQFDNDTDREAQMMFWIVLILFSFTNVSQWPYDTKSTGPYDTKSIVAVPVSVSKFTGKVHF